MQRSKFMNCGTAPRVYVWRNVLAKYNVGRVGGIYAFGKLWLTLKCMRFGGIYFWHPTIYYALYVCMFILSLNIRTITAYENPKTGIHGPVKGLLYFYFIFYLFTAQYIETHALKRYFWHWARHKNIIEAQRIRAFSYKIYPHKACELDLVNFDTHTNELWYMHTGGAIYHQWLRVIYFKNKIKNIYDVNPIFFRSRLR